MKHTRKNLKVFAAVSYLLPLALTPIAASAQATPPQNDAGAAIGSLFKSFMQAVQKAGDDTQPQAQAQAAPQPSPPQPIVPPSNLQKTSGLDYYIAIFKNSDPDVIRNYISTLKFQAKVIKWTDTKEFIVAIGPYVSEDERKRTADMILSKTPGLKPENLITFVFKKGTPDNQLVTSQSAQNALQFDPAAFAEGTSQQGEVTLASAPAAQQAPPPAPPKAPATKPGPTKIHPRQIARRPSPSNGGDKIGQIASALNPSGWARCVAGDVTVLALIARGDQIPAGTMTEHKAIGPVLGAVRSRMLLNHIPAASLDSMVRNYGIQIRSAPDPFIAAFQIVDECTGDIAKAAG